MDVRCGHLLSTIDIDVSSSAIDAGDSLGVGA